MKLYNFFRASSFFGFIIGIALGISIAEAVCLPPSVPQGGAVNPISGSCCPGLAVYCGDPEPDINCYVDAGTCITCKPQIGVCCPPGTFTQSGDDCSNQSTCADCCSGKHKLGSDFKYVCCSNHQQFCDPNDNADQCCDATDHCVGQIVWNGAPMYMCCGAPRTGSCSIDSDCCNPWGTTWEFCDAGTCSCVPTHDHNHTQRGCVADTDCCDYANGNVICVSGYCTSF